MEIKEIESAIEAILFMAGDGVEAARLAEILELGRPELDRIMASFMDRYNYERRGLKVIQYGDRYQLSTRPEYAPYLQKFAGSKRPTNLSNAALEVLSIIVYNQPVTRATIDKIRGVDSFGPLERLVEREIVEEKGRLEAPGRPILYGTTPEFLKIFGLKSLEEVPDLESIQLSMEETSES